MVNPYRMPVLTVTGDIPFRYPANYRGYIAPSDDWMLELNSLNNYIGEHPFWNRQVKRVFVNRSDDIHIVPLEEDLCLMIGSWRIMPTKCTSFMNSTGCWYHSMPK
jgi:hypothetical protein